MCTRHITFTSPPPPPIPPQTTTTITRQGYKFNIFYPDLIDKTKTPQFFIEPCEDPSFCIIRFHAGVYLFGICVFVSLCLCGEGDDGCGCVGVGVGGHPDPRGSHLHRV